MRRRQRDLAGVPCETSRPVAERGTSPFPREEKGPQYKWGISYVIRLRAACHHDTKACIESTLTTEGSGLPMEVGDVYRCTLCRRIAQASLGSPMSELSRFSVELQRSYVILYFQCDRLSRRLYFQIRHKDSDFRRIMGYLSRCFGGIRRNAACN